MIQSKKIIINIMKMYDQHVIDHVLSKCQHSICLCEWEVFNNSTKEKMTFYCVQVISSFTFTVGILINNQDNFGALTCKPFKFYFTQDCELNVVFNTLDNDLEKS
ncbi:hypothetical protein ACKWTF_006262 [Chironomus riparius]